MSFLNVSILGDTMFWVKFVRFGSVCFFELELAAFADCDPLRL